MIEFLLSPAYGERHMRSLEQIKSYLDSTMLDFEAELLDKDSLTIQIAGAQWCNKSFPDSDIFSIERSKNGEWGLYRRDELTNRKRMIGRTFVSGVGLLHTILGP